MAAIMAADTNDKRMKMFLGEVRARLSTEPRARRSEVVIRAAVRA
jgi:hypothetical protein